MASFRLRIAAGFIPSKNAGKNHPVIMGIQKGHGIAQIASQAFKGAESHNADARDGISQQIIHPLLFFLNALIVLRHLLRFIDIIDEHSLQISPIGSRQRFSIAFLEAR